MYLYKIYLFFLVRNFICTLNYFDLKNYFLLFSFLSIFRRFSPLNEDISVPHKGNLQFFKGSSNEKFITITVLPTKQKEETEESFLIKLVDYHPTELDENHHNITLIISRKVHFYALV